jgi:F0F1-type ATP synthase membrane subunit b/b'
VIDPVRRRRGIAFLIALALVGVGVLWVIMSAKSRNDASRELASAQASLQEWQAAAASARSQVTAAREQARNLVGHATATVDEAAAIAGFDEQEAARLRAAVSAAQDGRVNAFNSEVGVRNGLAAQHDAAAESVQSKVDALVAGLDGL